MRGELSVAVVGAGPAGLTGAYLLARAGARVTVLESNPDQVGGLSRTVRYKGFLFDIGGHRFYTKSPEIEALWKEILPDGLLERRRLSRIYYRGRFFSYPLKPIEAFRRLGPFEAVACVLSYLRARARPMKNPVTFEDWVTNAFGARLFETFFKTYTEKVWGMSCDEISADWAAQRIGGLSLGSALASAVLPRARKSARAHLKTLSNRFHYPRRGPGMMWEACADRILGEGGEIRMGRHVVSVAFDERAGMWQIVHQGADGSTETLEAGHLVSSAPLRELSAALMPRLTDPTLRAAGRLRYRDFLTVMLVLRDRRRFDDHWLYIHDPGVRVGRIQNFKAWSPEMVPEPGMCSYGMEYFCFEDDRLWSMTDADLVALGTSELARLGLANPDDVVDGCVVRQPKAYPVYDRNYAAQLGVVRAELEARFPTLHLVGRNGLHKYNNQDHAMMTAMLTSRNILAGERLYDVWRINDDAAYLENVGGGDRGDEFGVRLVPLPLR